MKNKETYNLVYKDKMSGQNILARRIKDSRRYELLDGRTFSQATLVKHFEFTGKIDKRKPYVSPSFAYEDSEEWKKFPLNTDYTVSSTGKVLNKNGNRIKCSDCNGYRIASLRVQGKFKVFSIHRVVAITFIPNPATLPEVNHIDGVRDNNNIKNLEWVTKSENILHAVNVLGKIKKTKLV